MRNRRIYFGNILADLASQAFHGHFSDARDYNNGTGVFEEDVKPHSLILAVNIGPVRFHYNTVTGQYTFYEMQGRRQGDPIVEGWDGLSSEQQEAFVGELYGFMRLNRMKECSLHEYLEDLTLPPRRVHGIGQRGAGRMITL